MWQEPTKGHQGRSELERSSLRLWYLWYSGLAKAVPSIHAMLAAITAYHAVSILGTGRKFLIFPEIRSPLVGLTFISKSKEICLAVQILESNGNSGSTGNSKQTASCFKTGNHWTKISMPDPLPLACSILNSKIPFISSTNHEEEMNLQLMLQSLCEFTKA